MFGIDIKCAIILILIMCLATKAWANNVIIGSAGSRLEGTVISQFDGPWAMSFIDSEQLLVTTKEGKLWLLNTEGEQSAVSGVPKIFAGQGGLGDIDITVGIMSQHRVFERVLI